MPQRASGAGDIADDMTGDRFIPRLPVAFLAVSYSPGRVADPAGPGGEQRVRAAAALLTGAPPVAADPGDRLTWVRTARPGDAAAGPGGGFTAWLVQPPGGTVTAGELSTLLAPAAGRPAALSAAAARALGRCGAPFALVSCAGRGHPLLALTDPLGIRQLYWHQGQGWAALSTSSLALSWCAQAALDHEALAVRAVLGFHLRSDTPFAGIRTVPGGTVCALSGGTVRMGNTAALPLPELEVPASLPELARSTARLLRAEATAALDDNPGLVLQLSGGLDSRVELAAIPPAQRAGLRALTLHPPGGPDGPVARRLAAGCGLDHQVLSLEGLASLSPAEAWRLVRSAAIRHDCAGDAAAHAALDWADRHSWPGARIHGTGGEIARGFYYRGQRQHAEVTPELVDRLAGWRLGPDAADLGCLANGGAAWAQECARAQIREVFRGYRGDWLSALDEFYLRHRVPRWAGLRLTVAATERPLLGPLMGPEFVARARACPVEGRRNSRFLAMVLMELDAGLGRIPLDTGYVPADLASARPAARGRRRAAEVRLLAGWTRRRLAGAPRLPAGSAVLAEATLAQWRRQPGDVGGVLRTGLIGERWLAGLLDGRYGTDARTVGFLAGLQAVADGADALRAELPRSTGLTPAGA